MAILPLKGKHTTADTEQPPERAALALAIAEAREVEARLAAALAPDDAADEEVWAGMRADEAAETALTEAKTNTGLHHKAVLLGTAGPAPMSPRQARDALEDAQASLQAARQARDALKKAQADGKQERENTARRLRAASVAVVRAEGNDAVAAVAAGVARLQAQLVAKGQALHWLIRNAVLPVGQEPGGHYGHPVDEGTRSALWRLDTPPQSWHEILPAVSGAAVWEQALSELMVDANAPLPG